MRAEEILPSLEAAQVYVRDEVGGMKERYKSVVTEVIDQDGYGDTYISGAYEDTDGWKKFFFRIQKMFLPEV